MPKHKDLLFAAIDSVVADACFMNKLVEVGGKNKPVASSPSSCSPSVALVATNKEGNEFCSPWEWIKTCDLSTAVAWWRHSLKGIL